MITWLFASRSQGSHRTGNHTFTCVPRELWFLGPDILLLTHSRRFNDQTLAFELVLRILVRHVHHVGNADVAIDVMAITRSTAVPGRTISPAWGLCWMTVPCRLVTFTFGDVAAGEAESLGESPKRRFF